MTNRQGLGVYIFVAASALLLLGACEGDSVAEKEPLATLDEGGLWSATVPRQTPADAPVDVRYRLLTTPQVGQPVDIEVSLMPLVDAASLGFQLRPDEGVLIAPATRKFTVDTAAARIAQSKIVSVTPQREGRFYINVDARIVVNGETKSRVVTIPIQVGAGGPELGRMGEVQIDADGNRIISLPASKPAE